MTPYTRPVKRFQGEHEMPATKRIKTSCLRAFAMAVLAVPILAFGTVPVIGAGTQTTQAPATPPTPAQTNLQATQFNDITQLNTQAVCSAQLQNYNFALQEAADGLSLGATAIGTVADAVGLSTDLASAAGGIHLGGDAVALAAGITTSISTAVSVRQAALPNCEGQFMGTISSVVNPLTGLYGGANISGNSIFNDNLAVGANLNVGGNITTGQLFATQGVSTNGGGIFIGDPNGTRVVFVDRVYD